MKHFVVCERMQILRMFAMSLRKSHLLNSFIQQTVLRYISLYWNASLSPYQYC